MTTRRAGHFFRALPFLAALAAAIAYLAIGLHVSSLFPKTTDQTSYFSAGLDVARGNWRLHGWVLTPPDFWTSDIALSALLSTLWHLLGRPAASPFLLVLQPAITWTALVASTIAIARMRLRHFGARWSATLLILAMLAFPLMRVTTSYFITLSVIHLGTAIYGLWSLHFADRYLTTGARSRLLAAAVLLWLGMLGDPMLAISTTLPILIYGLMTAGNGIRRPAALALGTLAATCLAPLVLALNRATGGFTTEALEMRFADWNQLGNHVSVTLHCLFLLFGIDPFGKGVSAALPDLARVPLLIVFVLALVAALRPWRPFRAAAAGNPLAIMLALACLLDLASLLFSSRIELEGNSIAAVRYLFPLWVCGTLLAALIAARNVTTPLAAILAVAFTLPSNIATLPKHSTGILSSDDNAALDWLEQHAPHQGIGSWWSSGNLQLASLNRLTVWPAIRDGSGRIVPFVHIHNGMTFSTLHDVPFFVLVPFPSETYDEREVVNTFGTPAKREQFGRFTVLTYPAGAAP